MGLHLWTREKIVDSGLESAELALRESREGTGVWIKLSEDVRKVQRLQFHEQVPLLPRDETYLNLVAFHPERDAKVFLDTGDCVDVTSNHDRLRQCRHPCQHGLIEQQTSVNPVLFAVPQNGGIQIDESRAFHSDSQGSSTLD